LTCEQQLRMERGRDGECELMHLRTLLKSLLKLSLDGCGLLTCEQQLRMERGRDGECELRMEPTVARLHAAEHRADTLVRDATQKREGFRGGIRSRADFPLHECSPYRGLHGRHGRLGFVHRSKDHSLLPLAKPCDTIRNFFIAVVS
jgi:hypothetical protein